MGNGDEWSSISSFVSWARGLFVSDLLDNNDWRAVGRPTLWLPFFLSILVEKLGQVDRYRPIDSIERAGIMISFDPQSIGTERTLRFLVRGNRLRRKRGLHRLDRIEHLGGPRPQRRLPGSFDRSTTGDTDEFAGRQDLAKRGRKMKANLEISDWLRCRFVGTQDATFRRNSKPGGFLLANIP